MTDLAKPIFGAIAIPQFPAMAIKRAEMVEDPKALLQGLLEDVRVCYIEYEAVAFNSCNFVPLFPGLPIFRIMTRRSISHLRNLIRWSDDFFVSAEQRRLTTCPNQFGLSSNTPCKSPLMIL